MFISFLGSFLLYKITKIIRLFLLINPVVGSLKVFLLDKEEYIKNKLFYVCILGNIMKKIAVLLIVILVVSVVFLGGCTDNQTAVVVSTKPPANINTFSSANEGDMIRFYFLLEDEDGINTQSDGHVKIEIFDDEDNSLYKNEFDVKSSEFVDYQFKLTGTAMGKAYEWRVPKEDIEKGKSTYGFGKAVLTFITSEFNIMSAEDTLVQIPTYSEEELEEMQESDYDDSAVDVNKKISKGSFEVTVIKTGFFDKYEWGETKQYFRVDMIVKNIGSNSEYFSPSGLAVIDDQGHQYEYTFSGTLDTFSTVYPGVTKNGYILFEDVPITTISIRLVFELGYDSNFNSYVFEYNINLK